MGALVLRFIATEFQKDNCTSVTCNDYTEALTAEHWSNMEVKTKVLLTLPGRCVPKCYFLLDHVVEVCLPQFILYDERYIWFTISLLPFLIAHHSFPITHSFNHHFRRIHYRHITHYPWASNRSTNIPKTRSLKTNGTHHCRFPVKVRITAY